MQSLFTDIATTLREEIISYRSLLLLVRGERARILKGDLRAIRDVVEKKEAIAEELQRLATCRTVIMDQLAIALGEEQAGFTLARLASRAPGEVRETLQGLLVEFRRLVGQLMAANEVNQTLLTHSLESVQRRLALFRTVATANPPFGATRRLEDAAGAVLALNQTA
jgi:flagellar biosynthesis/type III secretory pathway chaperone